MASKDPEEAANTATEEETLAFKRKRARRVSFADVEITSVHIFKRDEDYETPPDPQATPEPAPPDNEVLGFFRDLVDSDDSRESSPNEDDDVIGQRKSFLRPLGSPSPGSSTVCSAASNDEDDFFGPVSANFIRPGRLSDSAASDDNHDVTMDSTAFSMHFRSLAGSDSGRDLKTPTAVRLNFGERTPTQNTAPSNPDSFMALTKAKKSISPFLQSGDVVRSKDSNAMSIVGENSHKFDYGRLPPSLDALLTEGSRDLYAISVDEKLSKQNETQEVDLIGHHNYDEEISGRTEMENGSKEYAKHAVEESILHNGTPHKVFQSNGLLQGNLSDGLAKEDFLMDRRHETMKSIDYKLNDISPLKRSLSAECKTSFATFSSPAPAALVTPNSKLPDYRMSTGSMKFGKDLSSKQKSISKFRLPEPSPCISSIKEGIDRLKSRISSYSSMANLSGQPDRCKDLECKYTDIPIVRLEEQLFSSIGNNGEFGSSFSFDGSRVKTSKEFPRLSQSKEPKGSTEAEETPGCTTMANLSNVQPSKPAIEAKSPGQVTLSEKKDVVPHVLTSENRLLGSSTSIEIDALSEDIIINDREQNNSTSIHDTLVSSPLDSLDVRLLGATECPTSCFGELKQGDGDQQVKHVSACLTQGGDAAAHTSNTSPLIFKADKSSSLQSKSEAVSTSPLLKALYLVDGADNGGHLSNLQHNSETFSNLPLSSRVGSILKSRLASDAKNSMVSAFSPQFHKAQTGGPSILQSPFNGMPNYSPRRLISVQSSYGKKNIGKSTLSPIKNEQSQSSARKNPFRSPLRNDNFSETKDDVISMRKAMGSPTSSLSGHVTHDFDQASHISEGSLRKANHSLSGSKRRNIDTIPFEGDHDDIILRNQESPEVKRGGSCDVDSPVEEFNQMSNGSKKIEGSSRNRAFTHWKDISIKFSADINDLLPPLINELNSKALEKLEDTLVHLLKIKEYELLCSEIQSQNVNENLGAMHKRVVEARSMMCKVAYNKTKLQLVCAKRDGYLNRAQSLSSRIEDFKTLKLNFKKITERGSKSNQVDDRKGLSCPDDSVVRHEASFDRVRMMKQAFESLDGKINVLSRYFSTYCKLKAETSSNNILASVIDHLRKRKLCRSIYQDLQMWKVDDFEKKNDHYTVLLNYLSYACQRITVKANLFPSVTIVNTMNDTHIEKNFPEMNACGAFAFVLNVKRARKCIASRHLSEETQMMSSSLHNLLDVIEEMQMAQIEISNLILTRFHSPLDEHLDLQLSFIDFSSGRTVNLILNISDLNRGIYPSEVLPHKIESPVSTQYTLSELLLNDIRTAVGNLDAGYSRILRLCRCVSEVVQSSSSQ